MNIFVCLKQTPDTASQIKLAEGQNGIDTSGLEWIISPYDEFALEAALQMAEKQAGQVSVLSLGPPRVESALRRALAMGADKAYLIEHPGPADPSFVSAALAEAVKTLNPPDVILTGKAGVDENHGASGPMLAEHLDWPHIGFVTQIKNIQKEAPSSFIVVQRPAPGGQEEIKAPLPILLSIDKNKNQPRYPSLPGIIQAKKKPLVKIPLADLKPDRFKQHICFHSYQLPAQTAAAQMLTGPPEQQAAELVQLLKKDKAL